MKTLKLCYKNQTLEIPYEAELSDIEIAEARTFFNMVKMFETEGILAQDNPNTLLNANKQGYIRTTTNSIGNYPQNSDNANKVPNNKSDKITQKQIDLIKDKGLFVDEMFSFTKQQASKFIEDIIRESKQAKATEPSFTSKDIIDWEL